ncbi:MAG: transcription-repair coupling factor [Ignavibacteriaceae bacterium]
MTNDFSGDKIKSQFRNIGTIKNLSALIADKTNPIILISPLFSSSKSLLVDLLSESEHQIIVLMANVQTAAEFTVELSELGLSDHTISIIDFKTEAVQEKLTDILSRERFVLVSTYQLLNCEFPAKKTIEGNTTKIQVGGDLTYNDLVEYLNLLNYQKDKFVEAPGDYSQRGSIIDYWSFSEKNPVRLEFDGDFLESIRYFDPESQRSIEEISIATLAGSLNSNNEIANKNNLVDIFDYLTNPLILASSFELKNLLKEKVILFDEEKSVENPSESIDFNEDEFPEPVEKVNNIILPQPPAEGSDYVFNPNARWLVENELITSTNRIDLGFTEVPSINSNYEFLFTVLTENANRNYTIIITSENDLQSARLKDLLSEFKPELETLIGLGKVKILTLPIKSGFVHHKEKILLLSDYQIFNKPYRTKISTGKKYKKSKSKKFASINRGDFVVHENYGIGKYVGLETITIGDVKQESMKILYNAGGIVYVNLNYLTLVKKYSSNESADGVLAPTLSTLGTSEWVNTKARAKKKIKEAARELIELYAKRKATKGYQFSPDTVWQKELEASFFYEDTPDQEKVCEEVKNDMEAENPMDRLVCGDVGFGKTEIAVRAAFKAVQDGKQAAVLVPTTILAEQHFNTFSDRLSQFPIKVAALSRFQTKKQQAEIIKDLSEGKVDVVIGTHRLISKDVKFRDLGLLIIDEEHRFGVMTKEKLRSLKLNVDTLTLTATPIPRTLNLSLLGARDLSIIATPPPNRQSISTKVSTLDIIKIKEWILNELQRNGQVYIIHDRIQSIDKFAGYIQKYIPDLKIAVAHGQMKPAQLENVIHGFLNKKFDVLLSTKIIESGIDIPNVNTIIVNRADRFGLAELHQLRGRVGRSNRQAFAYFIVPSLGGISKKALRRLQAIEEFTEVGAGFNISMRDLEIRGAGNLLGTQQSGFINDVGFDLYIKMINEAVEELKYQEFKDVFSTMDGSQKSLPKQVERTDPVIDAFFEIGIPSSYMPDQMDRLNFYTTLYSIKNISEAEEIKEEMIDRFGPLPTLVKRFIGSAVLKHYASYALFERIIIQRKSISLILPESRKEEYYQFKFLQLMKFIMEEYKNTVKFEQRRATSSSGKDIMKLIISNTFETPEKIMEFLIGFCKRIMNLYVPEIKEISEETESF